MKAHVKLTSILLAGLLLVPVALQGQQSGEAESTTGLVPGDQVTVHFFDFPELVGAPLQGLTVRDDGSVHLPYVGSVKISGLGPEEAEHTIEAALQDRGIVKQPTVAVTLVAAKNYMIRGVGDFRAPHSVSVQGPVQLSWVVEQMGGMSGTAESRVTLIHRRDTMPTSIEYDPNAPSVTAMNTVVNPGDTVEVSPKGVVFVIGEVARPGIFSLSGTYSLGLPSATFGYGAVKKMTLLQALTQAGGVTAIAGRSHSVLLRTVDGKREAVTFDVVKLEKGEIADPVLQADDVVFIPSSYFRSQTNNLFSTILASLSAANLVKSF